MDWKEQVTKVITPVIEAYQRNETPILIAHADHAGRLKLNSLADLALSDPRVNDDIQARRELPRGVPARWLVKHYINQIIECEGGIPSRYGTYRFPPK